MIELFRKRSEKEKLLIRYKKLMEGAHRLSHIYRRQSDEKISEAERIMDRITRMD